MIRILAYLAIIHCIHSSFAFQPKPIKIQICQNKDCCKRFPSKYDGGLPQTVRDLIPINTRLQDKGSAAVAHVDTPIIIETTGCLSQCSSGPNISINDRIFGNVDDVLSVAAILEVAADVDSPGDLMAAVEDMATANKSTNEKTKIKYLNFAVRSLTKAGLASTAAMAHALVLRADVHLESYPQNIDQALEDTMKAIDIDSLHGRAWRVLADVREAKGDILEAMEAVSKWADVNPEFHAKATKELQRLRVTAGGTP